MVLLLVGCNGPKPVTQDAKGLLEIWIRKAPGSATDKTARRLAAAFTANTGVPTKVVAIFEGFEDQLRQVADRGDLPDIVINDSDQVGGLARQGLVRRIDANTMSNADQVSSQSWDGAMGVDGAYYGVPFSAQSFALLIRKDWRERVGLPIPTTWGELDELARAFTREDPDGDGKPDTWGFVIPASAERGYTSWYFSSFLWSAGADYITGPTGQYRAVINSPQAILALDEFRKQFCVDKTVVPRAAAADTTASHPLFDAGTGGIYLTGPYLLARFDKSVGKDKYEVVPLPPGPGGKSVSLLEGENVYLMTGSANEDGQRRFAQFAISVTGQTIGMAQETGGSIVRLPVNRNVDVTAVRKDPRWETFNRIYQTSGQYFRAVPDWAPFRQASADTFHEIVADCASSIRDQLDELNERFTAEIARQGVGGS
jgi:multiple sugar transport system substrate-binding protein